MTTPIYINSGIVQASPFLHTLRHVINFFIIFIKATLTGTGWISQNFIAILTHISLMINDSEHIFKYLLTICISFLKNLLFSYFAHLGFFFLLSFSQILDINPLHSKKIANISSHSLGCLFIFWLFLLLWRTFVVWFSSTCLFYLYCLCFWQQFQNIISRTHRRILPPYFLLGIL